MFSCIITWNYFKSLFINNNSYMFIYFSQCWCIIFLTCREPFKFWSMHTSISPIARNTANQHPPFKAEKTSSSFPSMVAGILKLTCHTKFLSSLLCNSTVCGHTFLRLHFFLIIGAEEMGMK